MDLKIFYFVILQAIPSIGNNMKLTESYPPTLIFITNIYLQNFKNCNIIFIQNYKHDNMALESFSVATHASIFNIYLEHNNSVNSDNFKKFTDAKRITNQKIDSCKLVIMTVGNLKTMESFFRHTSEIFAPPFTPLINTGGDYFVFITKLNLIDNVLLSSNLPAKVKYKIAVADSENGITLKSVCLFCNEGNPTIVHYRVNRFEILSNFNYFPDYTLNMMGKTLRISCPAVLSTIETIKPWNRINNAKRGAWKNLFQDYFLVKFNFTYNIFLSTGKDGNLGGGGTGTSLPNGSWIGIVGDLISGKADIGVVCAQTPQRLEKISYTNSFFQPVYLTFVTSYGQTVFTPKALLWPFNFLMWVCIFFSTILCFIIFKFLTKSLEFLNLPTENNTKRIRRENWGLEHQIFMITATYIDQDCVLPHSSPMRCFVGFLLLYGLIITTVYRSKMVALLAYPVTDKVPTTFEELSKSGYTVSFMKHGDAAYNAIKGSKDPVYVKLVKEMDVITGVGLDCMQRVISRKKHACIAYNISATYLKARNFSELESRKLLFSPASTYVTYLGIAFQGGSLFKEGFDRGLGWVRSFHLQHVWNRRDLKLNVMNVAKSWWIATNQTEKLIRVDDNGFSNLTLSHISGSFYALIGGILFGTITFAAELTKAYRKAIIFKNRVNY